MKLICPTNGCQCFRKVKRDKLPRKIPAPMRLRIKRDGTAGESVESFAAPDEFEISAEPVAEHDAPASILEPGRPSSSVVPPPDEPGYAEFQVSAPESPAETHPEEIPPAEEIRIPEPVAETPAPAATEKEPELAAVEQSHGPAKTGQPESEFELDQDYDLILEPEELVPAHSQKPPDVPIQVHAAESDANGEPELVGKNSAGPPAGSDFASDHFLADLANEIEAWAWGN